MVYKGYKLSIKSYCIVLICRLKLLFRRVKRWHSLVKISDIILFVLLTVAWVFVVIIKSSILQIDIGYAVTDSIESYFASVIIVGFISWYLRIIKYREENKTLLWDYYEVSSALCTMFNPLYGEMAPHYNPLYCDKTINETFCRIQNKEKIKYKKFEHNANIIKRELRVLEADYKLGRIRINGQDLHWEITNYENELNFLLSKYSSKRMIPFAAFYDLLFNSFSLIECLGKLWHQDDDINVLIYRTLLENGYNLMDDFYARMQIYSLEEIREYVCKEGLLDEIDESFARECFELMGIEVDESFNFEEMKKNRDKRMKDHSF